MKNELGFPLHGGDSPHPGTRIAYVLRRKSTAPFYWFLAQDQVYRMEGERAYEEAERK